MNVEDRLRAALHGTADLVEDRPRPLPTVRRRRPWLMPLWSALVVALVVAVPFGLPERKATAPVPPDPAAGTDSPGITVRTAPPNFTIGAAPKFYVTVYRGQGGERSRFEVRSTDTGAVQGTNYADSGESFLAIAPVPEPVTAKARYFYLLARVGESTSSGCAKYTIRHLSISAEYGFDNWSTSSLDFEAADGGPMALATTPAGDEVAYSFRDCREDGGWRIGHRWAGTTTTWSTGGKAVQNLAYFPDGQTLAASLRSTGMETGEAPHVELRLTRVGDPRAGFADGTENIVVLGPSGDLVDAMITPDGRKALALRRRPRTTGPGYELQEFPLGEGVSRSRGPLPMAVADGPENLRTLLKQHPSGQEVLFQLGDETILHGSQGSSITKTGEEAPDDLAW
jgi:hypothetical protein